VVGQGDLVPDDVLERQIFAILLRDERALLVIVVGRHHRGEIERELVRLALGGRRGVRRHLLDRRRRRGVGGDRRVGGRRLGSIGRDLLEQRILEQLLLDDFLELERGELQELDGLLQERCHDDPLALP
jgi:hypothetical protein